MLKGSPASARDSLPRARLSPTRLPRVLGGLEDLSRTELLHTKYLHRMISRRIEGPNHVTIKHMSERMVHKGF